MRGVSRSEPPAAPSLSAKRIGSDSSYASIVAVPLRLNVTQAQSSLARSPLLETLDSRWTKVDCRAASGGAPAVGFACGLYVSVGQVLGAGNEYRYTIAPDRSSLALRSIAGAASAAGFSVDMNVGYSVRLRGKAGTFSCGDPAHDINPVTKKKDYLHFHLHETIRIRPTADYALRATFAHTLVPDAPCRMRVLLPVERDITGDIAGIENKAVVQGEVRLSERLEQYAPVLAAGAKNAWQRLGAPYPVLPQPATYLLLHPQTLAMLAPTVSGRGDRLAIEGGLFVGASPEIVTSKARSGTLAPLPRYREVRRTDESQVILADATLGYAAANAILRKRLVGQRVRQGLLPPLTISNVSIYPATIAGAAKLAVRIDYRGTVRGTVFAWGAPKYDAASRTISVPDLRLVPAKKGVFGQIARPLFQQRKLLETVRSEAARELTDEFRRLDMALIRRYERTVENGVTVEGEIRRVNLQTIAPGEPGITAKFEVSGRMRVDATFDASKLLDMRQMAIVPRGAETTGKR